MFHARRDLLFINYTLPLRIHPAVNRRLHEDRLLQPGDTPPDRLINWLLMIRRTFDDSRGFPSRENRAEKRIPTSVPLYLASGYYLIINVCITPILLYSDLY